MAERTGTDHPRVRSGLALYAALPAPTLAELPSHTAANLHLPILSVSLYLSPPLPTSYAQGMELIKGASTEFDWNVNLGECARIWKGGCIIRAGFLDRIKGAYVKNPDLANLLVDPDFAAELNARHLSWRRVVTLAFACGIPCPALSASLNYLDTYRRARLPANLTQAQRDFFGGHSYKRTDQEGDFHTAWTESHKDIGDLAERNLADVSGLQKS